jgi:hypothetical protein
VITVGTMMNKTQLKKYATQAKRNFDFPARKGYEAGQFVMVYDGETFEKDWDNLCTKYGDGYTMGWKEAIDQIEKNQVWEVFTREWDEHFSNAVCRDEATVCDVNLIDFRKADITVTNK